MVYNFPERKKMAADALTNRPIPPLNSKQLSLFTKESIRSKNVGKFDPHHTINILGTMNSQPVIAFDIGGDKLDLGFFTIRDATLKRQEENEPILSKLGEGFLSQMIEFVNRHGLREPVGISTKSMVEGTKLLPHPDLAALISDLQIYGGDFAKVFFNVSLVNDAVAGIIASAVHVARENPTLKQIILPINGGGWGAAIWKDGDIYSTEAGHVKVIPELNPYNQKTPCGFMGLNEPCIERVGASGAGIEDIYKQRTGKPSGGKLISQLLQSGDKLAADLYDQSAILMAHLILGVAQTFGLLKNAEEAAIVCHGGGFKTPGYANRVAQILAKYLDFKPNLLLTYDFSKNACLDGAAIAALNKT